MTSNSKSRVAFIAILASIAASLTVYFVMPRIVQAPVKTTPISISQEITNSVLSRFTVQTIAESKPGWVKSGFIIGNQSEFPVKAFAATCSVDSRQVVVKWDGIKDTTVAPGMTVTLYSGFTFFGSMEKYTLNRDYETLNQRATDWLFAHHKVTGCRAFEATLED